MSTTPFSKNQHLLDTKIRPGALFWFTGLSGSGKSTLARGLRALLEKEGIRSALLDGDLLRQGLCCDLGFSAQDRRENNRRAAEVGKILAETGLLVLCTFISPYRSDRAYVRSLADQSNISFSEIFVDAPLSLCEARDPRGLYLKARRGELHHFTGIDDPYEAPTNPELHLLTSHSSIEETLENLSSFVLRRWRSLPTR